MVTPEGIHRADIRRGSRAGGVDVVEAGDLYIKVVAGDDAALVVGEGLTTHAKVTAGDDLRGARGGGDFFSDGALVAVAQPALVITFGGVQVIRLVNIGVDIRCVRCVAVR